MTRSRKERLLAKFHSNPPADVSVVRQFDAGLTLRLPDDYLEFLQEANGGEGFIGDAYVIFWRVEELMGLNKAYQVTENAPGLFLFGSDGGGEAFGFDTRYDSKPIVSVPFVGMDLKLTRPIAANFKMFLEQLSKS